MKPICFVGDVENDLCRAAVVAIEAAEEPVMLYVTSGGGDAYAALAVIAAMQRARHPVHTFGAGYVASAALDILAHGATRGCHPHTIFMTHAASGMTPHEKTLSLANDRAMYAHLPRVIENWGLLFGRRNRYWAPEQMLEFGLVDYVSVIPR